MQWANAAGETAQVASQMAKEALGQVGGAQPMSPRRRPAQVGQHAVQFGFELLHHGGRPELPAAAEAGGPAPQLALVLGFPDPPELPSELASPGSLQRRGQISQPSEPVGQAELMSRSRIHRRRATDHPLRRTLMPIIELTFTALNTVEMVRGYGG